MIDCGIVLGAQRLDHARRLRRRALRRAARLVQRVLGVDLRAELLRLGPVLALAAGQREQLRGEQLEALGVAPLGVDLEQLGADREAIRVAAHRLLEDLLGLQVAAVGEVDVGLGDRIDVADRVELAQRIAHRRRAGRPHRACRCAGRRWRRRTNRAAGGSRGTRSRRCPSASGRASGRRRSRQQRDQAERARRRHIGLSDQRSSDARLRAAGGAARLGAVPDAGDRRRGSGWRRRRRRRVAAGGGDAPPTALPATRRRRLGSGRWRDR